MPLRLERLARDRLAAVATLEAAGQAHPWSVAQLAEAFADERASVWGACAGAELVGYAVLYRLPFEAELQSITVAPSARRRGVARALLNRLVEEADNGSSERLLLEVRQSNQAAIALYAQAGFTVDGHRRHYYPASDGGSRGEDAVLMSKALSAGTPPDG